MIKEREEMLLESRPPHAQPAGGAGGGGGSEGERTQEGI